MYQLCRLAQWTHSRPSDLLSMRASEYEDYECLDFDLACMAWWDQLESLRNEQKLVMVPKIPAGKTLGPKYPNDKAILDHLMGVGVDALDPVLEGVTADDLMDLMDGWDGDVSA